MAEMRAPADWTEELLVRVAATIDYPPTPDIVATVRARLAPAGAVSPVPAREWMRPLALGLGVLVLMVSVVLSASSGAREAVADFLGLGVKGERIEILPSPEAGMTATPFPTPVALQSYATPVAASDLSRFVGFEPARPEGAGAMAGAYVVDYAGVAAAVLQYEDFDLWQIDLELEEWDKAIPYYEKGATILQETSVNGQPAWWIAGGDHIVRFVGPDGTVVAGSERTVDRNTLVWHSAAGINYRMETNLALQDALTMAATLP